MDRVTELVLVGFAAVAGAAAPGCPLDRARRALGPSWAELALDAVTDEAQRLAHEGRCDLIDVADAVACVVGRLVTLADLDASEPPSDEDLDRFFARNSYVTCDGVTVGVTPVACLRSTTDRALAARSRLA